MDARRLAPLDRLTRRPLPGPERLDTLGGAERRLLATTWLGRARNELQIGRAFAYLTGALRDLGAHPALVALAARAVHDEERHGEIAWAVACSFAGEVLAPPGAPPLVVPSYPGADPELELLLRVIGLSCVSETLGSAFLEGCLAEATDPMARAALRELLADEIDHARIGWAVLAARSAETRAAIAPWIVPLLEQSLGAWLVKSRGRVDADAAARGCPGMAAVAASLIGAARDLVLPGFARLRVDVSDAMRWVGHLDVPGDQGRSRPPPV